MAYVEYTFETSRPMLYQRARRRVTRMPAYLEGALVAPEATSTFSLVAPDGTAIIDAQTVTIADSVAQYTVEAADLPATLALGEGYQEVWGLDMPDEHHHEVDRSGALVLRPLVPVVSDQDLVRLYPTLAGDKPHGVTSFQDQIDEAWTEILNTLTSRGMKPYLLKDAWAFKSAHVHLTLAILFRGYALAQAGRGNYLDLSVTEQKLFEAAWAGITSEVDANHDGRPDSPGQERHAAAGVIHVGGAPQRRRSRSAKW